MAGTDLQAGYEFMKRNADYQTRTSQVVPEDPSNRFAYVKQDRNTFEIGADVYPTDNLSFGLGYKYKNNDYKNKYVPLNAAIGLKKDTGMSSMWMLITLLEKLQNSLDTLITKRSRLNDQRFLTLLFPEWRVKQTDKTYDYGIGADIYVIRRN